MWRTEGILGLTWEPVMLMGMRARMARMARMGMQIRRNQHRKPMMDQRRMWSVEGIVLDSVKVGLYISDQYNTIMVKQMKRQAWHLKRRLYSNM
jgi:hypothetical protein